MQSAFVLFNVLNMTHEFSLPTFMIVLAQNIAYFFLMFLPIPKKKNIEQT